MYRECCLTSEKLPQSKCSCDTYAKKDVQKSGFLVSGCTGDFFKHNIIEMEISKMSARELCYNINNISPPSPYHASGLSQCASPKHPVSCIEPGLATHFIHDIIHVSMPFSQIYNLKHFFPSWKVQQLL